MLTGGTGVGSRDQTFETISALLTKTLPGFGELFRMLSYAEIGAAAMLSRATGGLIDRTVVLAMPGSTTAVRLAMEKLILPEIAIWCVKPAASTIALERVGPCSYRFRRFSSDRLAEHLCRPTRSGYVSGIRFSTVYPHAANRHRSFSWPP